MSRRLAVGLLTLVGLCAAPAALRAAPLDETPCSAPGRLAVEGYLQSLLPDVAATLVAAGFVETVRDELESTPAVRSRLATDDAYAAALMDEVSRQALELQEQLRQSLKQKLGSLPWRDAFALACGDYPQLATRMDAQDAQDYLALERATLRASLQMASQGLAAWLQLPTGDARAAALEDAASRARAMPAYPFGFAGRAGFNALAIQGLLHGNASSFRGWMLDVRKVLGKGNSYVKSAEATRLRAGVSAAVDSLVRTGLQGDARLRLRTDVDKRVKQVLAVDKPAG